MPSSPTWLISFHHTSGGLGLNTYRRHVPHPRQVSKVCILVIELPGVCVTAAACWGEGPALRAPDAKGDAASNGTGEIWRRETGPGDDVAPGGEDRGPAVEAGRGCSSLKLQPNSLSAMNSSWWRTTAERNWNLCRRGRMTACFRVLLPKWQCLQMGSVLCWGAGGDRQDSAPSRPFPHLTTWPPARWLPLTPAEMKCLATLVPPSCHFSARERR